MSQTNPNPMVDLVSVEQLLDVINIVSETNYSRIFLKQYDFDTSTSWDQTKRNILEQFSGKRKSTERSSLSNLEKITKALMVLGKHYCEVFKLTNAEHSKIIDNIDNISFDGKPYSDVFPKFVDVKNLTIASTPILTSIEKLKSGVVFYFSTPRRVVERVTTTNLVNGVMRNVSYPLEVKKQYIDSVFIPYNHARAEFRIMSSISRREIENEMARLQDNFVAILSANKVPISDCNPININKAIESIYNDSSFGRVIDTIFFSEANGVVIPRSCRKEVGVCLRKQEYHLAGAQKENVKCVAVSVRWDNTVPKIGLKVKTELKLESLAHFNYNVSKRFEIDNPHGYQHAISMISDIEKAL